MQEGNSVTGHVSRNDADLSAPLTVQIESPASSVVSFNETVTIAAGQTSATFTVLAIEDPIDRPNMQVTLSVSAAGYAGAAVTLDVADNDRPRVSIEIDQVAIAESTAAPSARLEDVGRQLPPESFWTSSKLK